MARKRNTLIWMLLALALVLSACRSNPPVKLPNAVSLGVGEPEAISNDGNTLLVVRTLEESNELWLVAADGATSQKIFDFESPTLYAAFSPNGEHLAWATDKIWLAKADGSGQVGLLENEAGFGPIAWSPDGDEIAFIEEDTIRVTDLTGSVRTIAVAPESVRSLSWAALSTGEQRLFINSFPAEAPAFVASIALTGAEQQHLAEAEFFEVVADQLYLADPFEQGRLWVVNAADGSDARVLVESDVQAFAARPGGSAQVAVLQLTGELQYDLSLVDVSGQAARPLTSGSLAISPLWSPDGKTLYYAVFDLEASEDVEDPFTVMKLDLSQ